MRILSASVACRSSGTIKTLEIHYHNKRKLASEPTKGLVYRLTESLIPDNYNSSNTSGALILYHVRGMLVFLQIFVSESGGYRASGESGFRGFLQYQYRAGHSSVPGVFLW